MQAVCSHDELQSDLHQVRVDSSLELAHSWNHLFVCTQNRKTLQRTSNLSHLFVPDEP